MSNSHMENQLCLKGIKSGFTFVFSLKKDNVLIDRLSQDIEFG